MLIPERGERSLIVGQTGQGKTGLATWLLKRIERAPIIIYDTKHENKFLNLPASRFVTSFADVLEDLKEGTSDYIVFRPPSDVLDDPQELDEYLYRHYMDLPGVDLYVDEAKQFHTSTGRPFKGVQNIQERGRSRGITAIWSTQRPKMISNSIITEAQKIFIMYLPFEQDHKKLQELVPGFKDVPMLKPETYQFYFANQRKGTCELFNPVKLDKGIDSGYTDTVAAALPDAERAKRLVWI